MASNITIAAIVLVIEKLDNHELATLNNCVQSGFSVKDKEGYEKVETVFDCDADNIKDAFAFEVNRRVASGTFK